MDGRVLSELFVPERVDRLAPETLASYDVDYRPEVQEVEAGADPELLERLRALGYFD